MNLPSLALPPIGGLLVLLFGYVILVGPVNYLVLRRIDRREWAWITVPALIAVFTVGSFGIGGLLRGTDVIVHEVGIVRGAPQATAATIQGYLGIFSPSRATFQLRVPGDALLAAPINGDIFGTGTTAALDVLQGDPSRVRDLDVGYGSIRTLRAEASASGPEVTASLTLVNGRLQGSITNRSALTLEAAAIVVGTSAARLGDLAPGATAEVDLAVGTTGFNWNPMSDRILGPFDWDTSSLDEAGQRTLVRRSVIDQISVDPMTGFPAALASEGAMFVAWGREPVVPLELEGQAIRRVSNILYEVPFPYAVRGRTAFVNDLLRVSVLEVGATFFSRDPSSLNLGSGTVRVAYRPVPFEGPFKPSRVTIAMGFGGDAAMPGNSGRILREATRCEPGSEGCIVVRDGMPELELLDVQTGEWVQFEHLSQGIAYELAEPSRWVDPGTGELQARFVNETTDQVYFQPQVKLEGTVR
jgi:hypothetical protein